MADLLLEHRIDMNFKLKMKFAIDAAKGLIYLHNSNPVILHRDLKSDNLLVTQDWVVKVADFGLTRFISEKKQMTQVGTVRSARTSSQQHFGRSSAHSPALPAQHCACSSNSSDYATTMWIHTTTRLQVKLR